MNLSNAEKNLGRIAGFLGILQGCAWLTMALLSIIIYFRQISSSYLTTTTYMDYIKNEIYTSYLKRHYSSHTEYTIDSNSFAIFMWIYLVLDFFWIAISICQIVAINSKNLKILNMMLIWGIVTAFVSVTDLVLVSLIGHDFGKCLYLFQNNISLQGRCTNVMIPVLTITAKGFVLWIINVMFICILFTIYIRHKNENEQADNERLFNQRHIPRATIQHSPKFSKSLSGSINNHFFPYNAQKPWHYPSVQGSPELNTASYPNIDHQIQNR